MNVKPIREAHFLDDYIVEVVSGNGSVIRLNMAPFLSTIRFGLLKDPQVWKTGTTDGVSIRWPGVAEISYEEIMQRAFW